MDGSKLITNFHSTFLDSLQPFSTPLFRDGIASQGSELYAGDTSRTQLSPGQGYITYLVWALNLPSSLQLPGLIWTWDPNRESSWQLPCHQLLLLLWFWFPPPLGYLGFPILFQQLFVVLSQHFHMYIAGEGIGDSKASNPSAMLP